MTPKQKAARLAKMRAGLARYHSKKYQTKKEQRRLVRYLERKIAEERAKLLAAGVAEEDLL